MAPKPVPPGDPKALEENRRRIETIYPTPPPPVYYPFVPDIRNEADADAIREIDEYRDENRKALVEIRRIIADPRGPNWSMPPNYLMSAQDISRYPPAQALDKIKDDIKAVDTANSKQRDKFAEAVQYKGELNRNPITNAGRRGLLGYFWRQLLATINATPLTSLNLFEVNGEGLQVFQPFATISRRTVRWRELKSNELTLSVNPPAYFDSILGFLRQFFKSVVTPWGEMVLYERGSGRDIARAVALWPDAKIKEIRTALEKLSLADDLNANLKIEPRKVDLLTYYEPEKWDW